MVWLMLPVVQDAKLVKIVVTYPAIFPVHFDGKQLGVAAAVAFAETITVVAVAITVVCGRLSVDALGTNVLTAPAGGC